MDWTTLAGSAGGSLVVVAAAWGAMRERLDRSVEDRKELHGEVEALMRRINGLPQEVERQREEIRELRRKAHETGNRVAELLARQELWERGHR